MPIAADTLFAESQCYLCLGISQAEAMELALLNRIASGTGSSQAQFYFMNIQGGWPAGLMNDGLSYYFMGNNPFDLRTTTYDFASMEVPVDGTIVEWYLKVYWTSITSGETVQHFLRLNDTTDIGQLNLIYNSGVFTAEGRVTGLSTAVTKGMDIAMKVQTPVWANNPAGIRYQGLVKIETS